MLMSNLKAYNVRASTALEGDIAMSVTTNIAQGLTYAIVYGCSEDVSNDFLVRLRNSALKYSGRAFEHPMLMPGLFAEIQRDMHVAIVEKSVSGLFEYAINLGADTLDMVPHAEDVDRDEENSAKRGVDLWLDVSHYRTTVETWMVQLRKMVVHLEELETTAYTNSGTSSNGTAIFVVTNTDMIREGKRIKERLLDIINDYDELQRKCTWVMDGTSLANGMASEIPTLRWFCPLLRRVILTRPFFQAWNHLARQDNKIQLGYSTQMWSIALLTMIFLPGTYVAVSSRQTLAISGN